jgi:hypothetical protein
MGDAFRKELEHQAILDWKNILSTESGIRTFARILNNLGAFSPSFTTNSNIYKNAALNDFARGLIEEMDSADMQFYVAIKKYMLRLKNEYATQLREEINNG